MTCCKQYDERRIPLKKFIHVRERISLNCKKWTCNVRRALFSPVLKDNTAILNNKNCVSTRFLLVFLMLLFLLDLICQVLFFRFIEFGYCIYMLMGIGFMVLIYYAFVRESGNEFPRKPVSIVNYASFIRFANYFLLLHSQICQFIIKTHVESSIRSLYGKYHSVTGGICCRLSRTHRTTAHAATR